MTRPIAEELRVINGELANLLHSRPADLNLGADHALADELVICGILGGKDVGKSTLVNALAEAVVSVDAAEVGKGTERPMAYVHQQMQAVVTRRLDAINGHSNLEVTVHNADAIRNVVLIDLPDFDSEFQDHLRVVQAVAPLLDRVLWVQTPRKIGDRAWVEMFSGVIKDVRNVHCVLNKVDELLADGGPASDPDDPRPGANGSAKASAQRFWDQRHEWVAQSIEAAGCPQGDEHRFLVAAAFARQDQFVDRIGRLWDDPEWSRFSSDRQTVVEIARLATEELARLRLRVLAPVTEDQAREIKHANREREREVNVETMRRHYDIDRSAQRLAQACAPRYLQELLNETMGVDYPAAVAGGLQTRLRPDTELADELLERRVEHWPLLRLVHWPFGWLSRVVGRRYGDPLLSRGLSRRAGTRTRESSATEADDPFLVEGRTLVDRIELARSRFLSDNAVMSDRLGITAELPEASALGQRVNASAGRLVPQLETRLVNELSQQDRRPSFIGKAMLWLILLWFPILQPVVAGGLELYVQEGGLDIAHGLYKIVSALSAVHLLAGFAVVGAIYVALLAGMYARRLRAVRRMRDEQNSASLLAEGVDDVLAMEVVIPLARPFKDRLERLQALQRRLDA